jgi:quercetin dioxygenase-like cupin family protein
MNLIDARPHRCARTILSDNGVPSASNVWTQIGEQLEIFGLVFWRSSMTHNFCALRCVFVIVAVWLTPAAVGSQATPPAANSSGAKPLMLEKDEGELRYRRIGPYAPFMLKVSPANNGSQQLVLGEEDVRPGHQISKHKHLEQDEILLIQTGTAHVWLGDNERDLHAGGLVFIPQNTWISVKNVGADPMHLVFIFSAPGFEEYMRCMSVPASAKDSPAAKQPLTDADRKACSHQGHVVYEALEGRGRQ